VGLCEQYGKPSWSIKVGNCLSRPNSAIVRFRRTLPMELVIIITEVTVKGKAIPVTGHEGR
jgi:hypothetical protein